MKGQASVIVLAILCIANAILPAASQTALGGAKGNKARTTSGLASAAGLGIGPLTDMLAQALMSKPQIKFHHGHGYPNNQNADQSYLLPMMMIGGDSGRKFATMSMLMNNNRGSNSNNILPFLFMGQDNMMWPLMFMNSGRRGGRGGSGMNPATMMFAMGHELF